ncbi:GNAT family N-acetyltransferase [Pedobacter nyackensis]|uniref:GNAT family N-acetyltransferase n=1 Tax=Pedobacter nyackensis TaxID=475255 RepID=UPI00292CED50|nr:GNAT family N-acetyltransferase [Pedobacter nyackensis]
METTYYIERVTSQRNLVPGLVELTTNVVEGGASVGFMLPVSQMKILNFWKRVLIRVEQGEIILIIARDTISNTIIGTVQLVLDLPENQPHRAEVAKMQVLSHARNQGVGGMLLKTIEDEAVKAGKSLLVLDTATGSPAEKLYASHGWKRVGEIPFYALYPNGSLCNTTFFFKSLSMN